MNQNTASYKVKQYLMFAGPGTILFFGTVIVPFLYGLYLTLTSWDGTSRSKPFVGLENFVNAFKDTTYWQAMGRTVIYSIFAVILINIVAFALAYLVTSGVKGQNFFRAGFFVPNLIGGIVLGYVWQFVFNRAFVAIGKAISGGTAVSLLSTPNGAMCALIIVSVWQYAGYIMMIYVAAIQSVPGSIMEAASVDGAGYLTRVRRILMPMVANAFTITLFLTLTNSFKQYDLNVTLTNGGPAGTTMTMSHYIYNNAFGTGVANFGYASAMSFLVFILVAILAVINLIAYNLIPSVKNEEDFQ